MKMTPSFTHVLLLSFCFLHIVAFNYHEGIHHPIEEKLLGSDKREFHLDHVTLMENTQSNHCSRSNSVCYKPDNLLKNCWGYENGCQRRFAYHYPNCNNADDTDQFWRQVGFGFVKEKIDSVETLCQPEKEGDSYLRCAKNTHYCEAGNLYMDLRNVDFDKGEFNPDLFKGNGDIGGSCKMIKEVTDEHRFGDLRSWYAELKSFRSLKKNPFYPKNKCDEVINKTTIFIKLDVGMNLFHSFCNFVNLYITQHVQGNFTRDVDIVYWRTSQTNYFDIFPDTWRAFTMNPTREFHTFRGKKVCFKHVIFSFLPRMIPGIYYTMVGLKPNCHGGGLLQAFSEHLLHRLQVPLYRFDDGIIRVTLISRQTEYRKITNEKELVKAMEAISGLQVTVVNFTPKTYPFLDQIKIVQNTDILMGMHGAGLTHMLFQPNWGAVFEIFNTGDWNCYKDLARARGLSYHTWEYEHFIEKGPIDPHHSGNQKFANYKFDVNEFLRLVMKMIKDVKEKRPKGPKIPNS